MSGFRVIFLASLLAATAVPATAQVIRLGDSGMSCEQIMTEANKISEALGRSIGVDELGAMALDRATQGTGLAGAATLIPGAGLVDDLLTGNTRQDPEQLSRRAMVEKRWYFLNGLYHGRNCDAVLREKNEKK